MNRETRRFCAFSCVVLAVFLVLVYVVASAGKRAEFAYLATATSTRAVQEFVIVNERWPESWEELRAVSLEPGPIYSWPEDLAEIQKQVEINFHLTLMEVAEQDPNGFTAIRPKRPAYSAYKTHFASLIKTSRLVSAKHADEESRGHGGD